MNSKVTLIQLENEEKCYQSMLNELKIDSIYNLAHNKKRDSQNEFYEHQSLNDLILNDHSDFLLIPIKNRYIRFIIRKVLMKFEQYLLKSNGKIKKLVNHSEKESSKKYSKFVTKDGFQIKLTSREKQCLDYLLMGYSARETSEKIFISPRTIERHIESLRDKFNVKSKIDLISKFHTCDIIELC